jgi:hypothetical protein
MNQNRDTTDAQDALATMRDLIQARIAVRQNHAVLGWRDRSPQLTAALRALTPEQGREIARELWAHPDRESLMWLLGLLGASVPGAMAELVADLATAHQFWPGWLYLDAPGTTTQLLLQRLDDPAFGEERNALLLALAWIGDDQVREQFAAWRANAPPWRSDLYLAPHEYAAEAGWELTPDGGRRQLYRTTSYELVPIDEAELTPSAHAAAVATPHEALCGWCGRSLVTLLDIELRDPRCGFVVGEPSNTGVLAPEHSPDATRLRVAHCMWCSTYATLYTDVDLHGGSQWTVSNGGPDDKPRILEQVGDGLGEDLGDPQPRRLALGAPRRTPFEALGRFMLDVTGISQLGGHPEWIQDTAYPRCPDCQRRMVCIGQVSWEDIDGFAEGSTYAFLCVPCGKAATVYQQT